MKVVKIRKSYRNGIKEHNLVVTGDTSKESIDYKVEEWCEGDPSGQAYGYDVSWEYVEDKSIIEKASEDRLKIIDFKISSLKEERGEIIREMIEDIS